MIYYRFIIAFLMITEKKLKNLYILIKNLPIHLEGVQYI